MILERSSSTSPSLTPAMVKWPFAFAVTSKLFCTLRRIGLLKQCVFAGRLPFCMRVLLESALRNFDGFRVTQQDVEQILDWKKASQYGTDVSFRPARVILQDFTGIPAVVDFAAMRNAVKRLGGDPAKVNPVCPADLVIDHAIQVDLIRNIPSTCSARLRIPPGHHVVSAQAGWNSSKENAQRSSPATCRIPQIEDTPVVCPFHQQPLSRPDSIQKNQELEFERHKERFQFLKWGAEALNNILVVPPASGIAHQVNLEHLARIVFDHNGYIYPDSLVGTDSHTAMMNGLGVLSWGVGAIEAEAVMMGHPVSLSLPKVVGYRLVGQVGSLATSTEVVLAITKHLRQVGISGSFVEFFGPGVTQLSIADRATIANMCPEYGALAAFFPMDSVGLKYLKQMGCDEDKLNRIECYLQTVKLLRDYVDASQDPEYSLVVELDLGTVMPSLSGPKRPQDRVALEDMKDDFKRCLNEKVGFKGYQVPPERQRDVLGCRFGGADYDLRHGSVVVAAITSYTNNSNPSVMLTAGLLAKKAVEAGLSIKPYIKTSLLPGSGVVTHYLNASGMLPYMEKLGFEVVGYGCRTCIGNSGALPECVVETITRGELVVCGVLSGNKNFKDQIFPKVRANYLASPPLVIAYAIAGNVGIDFATEPLHVTESGQEVFLRDVWPSREEVQEVERQSVIPCIFQELKEKLEKGQHLWASLQSSDCVLYPWNPKSTFIKCPPFFDKLSVELEPPEPICDAHVLVFFGNSVTTNNISPGGSIPHNSPAAHYLSSLGLTPREFNSYGTRRGNDEVMMRGTFSHVRLVNKIVGKMGPKTIHFPSGDTLDIYDAAERYQRERRPLIILAGKDFGIGGSRDWVAKGPYLLGVRAVLAETYDRVLRASLVGVGIVPLQFLDGQNAESLGLTGRETYTVHVPAEPVPNAVVDVQLNTGHTFQTVLRLDSDMELTYYNHGGLLNYTIRTNLQPVPENIHPPGMA
uniref:aconitate hydratase n=1 Tax=Eptatretus burgeri TaxID=7764 RepID=A0A8C4X0S3_EPTBU